MAAKGAKKLNH